LPNVTGTRVVNIRKEPYDVYIGRGSFWGNPFIIGIDGNRAEVIEQYKEYIYTMWDTETLTDEEILKLKGKRLGCFCKPAHCHGDILVQLVEDVWQDKNIQESL
jgi:hypothetical protein